MELDFCDFDGMSVLELREMLESYSDDARFRVKERYHPGGFGQGGYNEEYLVLENEKEGP